MAVLGSAEVELTLDTTSAARDVERELPQKLGQAADKAGRRLEQAIGDSGRKAGTKIEQALSKAGQDGGRKAGEAAGEGVEEGVDRGTRGIGAKGIAVGAALGTAVGGALGTALGSVGDLITGALEKADLTGTLQAKLGGTTAEAGRLGKVAGDVYASNFGGSLAEVGDALVLIRRNSALMAGGAEADLRGVTQAALVTAQTIGGDLNRTIDVAGKLVRNGLAPNAKAAFDLLVVGAQRGTDSAGDLLDTFEEYSPQFQKLGIQGPQALGLLDQAIRAGARNTDIAADAFKEFSIRAIDGTELTAEGFRGLGLDAGDMAARIAAGGKTANGALDLTLDRLRAIPDPVKRSQVAVALFGTQAEDLGQSLFALDPSTAVQGLGDVAGAADRAGEALASGPQAKLDAFIRSMQGKATTVLGTFAGYLSSLPGPAQAAAGGLGAGAVAVGALLGAVGFLGPKLKAGRDQLDSYGKAGERANRALGSTGRYAAALGTGAAVIGTITAAALKLQDALVDTPPAVNELTKSFLAARAGGDIAKALSVDVGELGESIGRVVAPSNQEKFQNLFTGLAGGKTKALREATERIDAIDQALTGLVQSGNQAEAARQFGLFEQAARAGGRSSEEAAAALPKYKDALAGLSNEATLNAGSQGKQGEAIKGATGNMQDQLSTAERLTAQLDLLSGAAIDNTRADIAVRDAKDALTAALKENGRSFDLATPKGRANTEALLDARDAAARYAEAQEKLNPGVGKGTAAFKAYVGQLVQVLRAANVSEAEIRRFTQSVLEIPPAPPVKPKVDTKPAETELQKLARQRVAKVEAMPETTDAEVRLKQAARTRVAKINLEAQVAAAEATMTRAARARSVRLSVEARLGAAEAQLRMVARTRTARLNAYTATSAAERALNYTARNRTSVITQILNTREYNPARRMAGGPVTGGVPYIVGEAGPELIIPRQSGVVIPNNKAFGQQGAAVAASPVRLHAETVRELGAVVAAAVASSAGGNVYLGREKVGAVVSRDIGSRVAGRGV